MFSFFVTSGRPPLVPVFLWASVCSSMYGRFCFHHIGLVLTKRKERLQWCPNTVLCPVWVGSSHMRTISQNLLGNQQELMRIVPMCGNSSHAPSLDTNLHPVLAKIDCDTLVAIRVSRVFLYGLQKKRDCS